MNKLESLELQANQLVDLALKVGADACDVVVASGNSISISVRDGKLENSDRSEGDNISLRVFCDNKVASVNSNTVNNLEALAERAVSMARVSPDDPSQGLADKSLLADQATITKLADGLDLVDGYLPDAEELETLALEAENAGLSVADVSKSMGASAGHGTTGFVLATSDGFCGSYERSGSSISTAMVAGENTGMERDYDFSSATHFEDLLPAQHIGRSAGERAARRLNPKQVKSGNFPILFDPRISAGVLGTLAGAINGGSIVRKTSFLRDLMGELIAGKNLNIVDDPHMKRRNGSRLFDSEGVANEKINLVSSGVLQEWVLDSNAARELGLNTNGRAARSGSGTTPSTTNCYMEPGEQTPEELIASISQGLYLTETIGHGVNMVTGDYSKGAAGFWIENGEITYPVAEVTIAGNLKDMFLGMIPADDLEFKYSTNAPTLLIEGMTLGGK